MSNKYPGSIITSGANAGYSVALDGTGDNLTTATNVSIGTQAFTYELFVYFTASPQGYLIGQGTSGGAALFYESGVLGLARAFTGNDLTFSTTFTQNTWNHIAVVRSGTGTNQTAFFINGTRVATGTVTSNYVTSGFYIGGFTGATYVTGYISNARIVVGSAVYDPTQTTIRVPTQLFNIPGTQLLTCNSPSIIDQSPNAFAITVNGNSAASTFTPFTGYTAYNPALGASTPGVWTVSEALEARQTRRWNMYDPYFNLTTLLLHGNGTNGAQNNTFLDSSSNNFTITRNGNTTQGTFSPFSQTGWSNFFDGSGDYLNNSTLNATFTGDFTFEGWVFVSTYTNPTVFFGIGSETTNRMMFGITNSGQLFANYSGQPGNFTFGNAGSVTLNTWHHVAFVRSSSNINAYLNGVAQGTAASYSTTVGNTGGIGIGANHNGSYPLTGYMSNVRYTAQALYTSTFTPSTTPLTLTSQGATASNVRVLSCQDNRFIDNSNSPITLTVNGNPSVQAFSPFYPVVAYTPQAQGGSGYFDGTGDYLTAPSNAAFGPGTGDFTIEFWLYATVFNDSFGVCQFGTTGTNWEISSFSNNLSFWRDGSGAFSFGANPIVNSWNHFAMSRSGNNLYFYRNGTRTNSLAFSSDIGATNSFSIGLTTFANKTTTGYISSFRYIKGTALYTGTTLTVPTAPLTAITNTSLLCNFTNAGVIDSTGDNVLETVGNASISTVQSKFGGSSMLFDGNDALVLPYTQLLDLKTSFTIEAWIYPTNVSAGYRGIYTINATGGANYGTLALYHDGTTLGFELRPTSGGGITTVSGGTLSANTWQHVAISVSSLSGRLFLNGSQVGSTTTFTDYSFTVVGVAVGNVGNNPTSTQGFVGYIDELRITRGVARYLANTTVQTSQWQDQ